MNKNKISCLIEIPHLISVNGAYRNKSEIKRYLTPEAAMEKQKIRASLRDAGLSSGSWGSNNNWYKLEIVYYLSTNYMKRDVDNLNKLVLDGITDHLGFDDSRIVTIVATKCKLNNSRSKDSEFIKFTISKLDGEESIDRSIISNLFTNNSGGGTNELERSNKTRR